jgi:eukaryotic-like serine/threonine-protein kinase
MSADATLGATAATTDASPSEPLLLARGTVIGRYLIVGELGRGATSHVYSAYDGDLDRRVALKLVDAPIGGDDEHRRRLLREAQSMARIRHVHVVAVHDVGTYRDRLYVAMEFVEGTTLAAWCANSSRTRDEILDAFAQAGSGLAAAHAVGVVHRDFKPENALVDAAGAVRVVDFGLALTEGGNEQSGDGSRPVGTPAYMSPEHYAGSDVDARSDQFSFCVALFEALWGARPFRGATIPELATAVVRAVIDEPPNVRVPRRIREVIVRGLARRATDRHASMDDLLLALARARRRRWPRVLGIAAALAAAVALWRAAQPHSTVPSACMPGAERVSVAWSPARAEALRLADPELSPSYIRDREAQVRSALDLYASDWAATYDELCPSLVTAPADDAVALARRECVDDRLGSLAGLVEFFEEHTVSPARVQSLLDTLPRPSDCTSEHVARLESVPADPIVAEEVRSLRRRIDNATRSAAWNAAVAGASELVNVIARARELDQPQLLVSALRAHSTALYITGDLEAAERAIDEALMVAAAAGEDLLLAETITDLIEQAPRGQVGGRDLERWFRLALALIERVGDDPLLRGQLLSAWGIHLEHAEDFTRALEVHEEAERALEVALGADNARTAFEVYAQAVTLMRLERFGESRERVVQAIAVFERQHAEPGMLVSALQVLAFLDEVEGDRAAANASMRRVVELATSSHGARGRLVSAVLFNSAQLQAQGGQFESAAEALAESRRAWPVGDDLLAEAEFVGIEAMIAGLRGESANALRLADRTLAAYAAVPGVAPRVADEARAIRVGALFGLADYRGVLVEAAHLYELGDPLEIDGRKLRGVAHTAVASALALDDRDAARLWVARAEIRPAVGVASQVEQRFTLAMFSDPGDPVLAAAVARDRDTLARVYFERHPLVLEMESWLRGEHPATLARRRAR